MLNELAVKEENLEGLFRNFHRRCVEAKPVVDNHHGVINYLRLSVTDRCNLSCVYCMPEQGVQFMLPNEILCYKEMLYLVELCIQ